MVDSTDGIKSSDAVEQHFVKSVPKYFYDKTLSQAEIWNIHLVLNAAKVFLIFWLGDRYIFLVWWYYVFGPDINHFQS